MPACLDRPKLARVLGMLGSAHAGERDAAGLAAHRIVTEAGATWADLLAPSGPDWKPEPEPGRRSRRRDPDMDPMWHMGTVDGRDAREVADCLLRSGFADGDSWQFDFLRNVANRRKVATFRQCACLARKLREARAAGVVV